MLSSITISNGLALYRVGEGSPLLLFPYPHASTMRPMGEDKLAALLAELGYQVITFDPPGAYLSTRTMRGDMAEMLACATEILEACQVQLPLPVVGHSMGGLCALGFSIEQPELVKCLMLIGACSGFPAVFRWSTPHNWNPWHNSEWWQCMWLGFRQMIGMGNLAVHKRLDNLVESASFVNQKFVEKWIIEPYDRRLPPPPRARWLQTVRRVDYRHRLGEIRVPTLLCVGRFDPQTPVSCSKELETGIRRARLRIFEHSGHSPFIEEPDDFYQEVGLFLMGSR